MGVTVETITPGDGVNFPKTGQTVTVHYSGACAVQRAPSFAPLTCARAGRLTSGSKFDSGENFQFRLGVGEVIKARSRRRCCGRNAVLTSRLAACRLTSRAGTRASRSSASDRCVGRRLLVVGGTCNAMQPRARGI